MIAHPRINCCISWGLPFHDIHATYWPVSFIFNSAKCRVTYFPALFSNSTYRNTNITRDALNLVSKILPSLCSCCSSSGDIISTSELTMSFVVGYYINTCEQLYLPEIEACRVRFYTKSSWCKKYFSHYQVSSAVTMQQMETDMYLRKKVAGLTIWWVVVSHKHEMKVYSKMA